MVNKGLSKRRRTAAELEEKPWMAQDDQANPSATSPPPQAVPGEQSSKKAGKGPKYHNAPTAWVQSSPEQSLRLVGAVSAFRNRALVEVLRKVYPEVVDCVGFSHSNYFPKECSPTLALFSSPEALTSAVALGEREVMGVPITLQAVPAELLSTLPRAGVFTPEDPWAYVLGLGKAAQKTIMLRVIVGKLALKGVYRAQLTTLPAGIRIEMITKEAAMCLLAKGEVEILGFSYKVQKEQPKKLKASAPAKPPSSEDTAKEVARREALLEQKRTESNKKANERKRKKRKMKHFDDDDDLNQGSDVEDVTVIQGGDDDDSD